MLYRPIKMKGGHSNYLDLLPKGTIAHFILGPRCPNNARHILRQTKRSVQRSHQPTLFNEIVWSFTSQAFINKSNDLKMYPLSNWQPMQVLQCVNSSISTHLSVGKSQIHGFGVLLHYCVLLSPIEKHKSSEISLAKLSKCKCFPENYEKLLRTLCQRKTYISTGKMGE